MRVFITGGTGFIGSEVVKELLGVGYEIFGLARSESSAEKLRNAGAVAINGSIEDLESLARGAEQADAVIHCGFIHNFADFMAAVQTDRQAIEAIGNALIDTNKPFIVTSGVPSGASGHIVTENDETDINFPRQSEQAALPFAEKGVRVSMVRPSRIVHGNGNFGFISMIAELAKEKGVSAYAGEGNNRLHAVHVFDLAKLYLLALEKGENAQKYQGVGDFAVPYREVAEFIGGKLNVPVTSISADEVMPHFGFVGQVVGADNPASSEITQRTLDWKPVHPSLMEDLAANFNLK
jgi:nucleoside-diphosphate-sugar epimerase